VKDLQIDFLHKVVATALLGSSLNERRHDMLEGKQVLDYFKEHPECAEKLKNIKYQFRHPKTFEPDEELYRSLEVSDISFITFEGWEGQKGVFAWYYPCGVPHYTQIA